MELHDSFDPEAIEKWKRASFRVAVALSIVGLIVLVFSTRAGLVIMATGALLFRYTPSRRS